MRRIGLSTVPAVLCLSAGLLLTACSSTPKDITQGWTPERIYQEARDEVAAGAWDKAIGLFEKLEGRAAGTTLAQQAQIEKAYAQYKTGEKVQALATLDRFIRLHPTSPALDYALYLKGLVNFNDNLGLFSALINQDLSERDQKAAKESYESFLELSNRFPESKYTPDAASAHDLHRQLAGGLRGQRRPLLPQTRRLRGRHQPRPAGPERLPERASGRRSAGHPRLFL